MRIAHILITIMILTFGLTISSCSDLKTTKGNIAGTVFFSDEQTRVGGAWIRVHDSATDNIVAQTQVDNQARFFFLLPEGTYTLSGAVTYDGTYTRSGVEISVFAYKTTRLFLVLDDDPPS